MAVPLQVPKIIEGMAVAAVDGGIVIGWEEVVPMLSRRPVSLRFRPAIRLPTTDAPATPAQDAERVQEVARRRQDDAAAVLRQASATVEPPCHLAQALSVRPLSGPRPWRG